MVWRYAYGEVATMLSGGLTETRQLICSHYHASEIDRDEGVSMLPNPQL